MADLASRQHSVVAYWQLVGMGIDRGWIGRQARGGWLHRLYRGVYAVGQPVLTEHARSMAAVLACGPGAHLALWRAAKHWDLLQGVPPIIDVVLTGNRTGPRNVRTHRVKHLHQDDRTIRHGIPVTTVPRTLLDLAAVADKRQLRRAVNQAARQGWLNQRVIKELIERHPRRKGITAFRAITAAVSPQTRRTRSDLEDHFLTVCKRYGLPEPISNTEIDGFEVDFHFPGTNLIVELDSYEYHRTAYELDRDHRRDARLKTSGYEVIRVSEMWLDNDPQDVADTIRELLRGGDARPRGGPL